MSDLPRSIQKLVTMLYSELKPEAVILFGSRARGDHRINSDFDIAVKATSIDVSTWRRILSEIEDEAITLHKIDLVYYQQMNASYRKQIDEEGVVLGE